MTNPLYYGPVSSSFLNGVNSNCSSGLLWGPDERFGSVYIAWLLVAINLTFVSGEMVKPSMIHFYILRPSSWGAPLPCTTPFVSDFAVSPRRSELYFPTSLIWTWLWPCSGQWSVDGSDSEWSQALGSFMGFHSCLLSSRHRCKVKICKLFGPRMITDAWDRLDPTWSSEPRQV